jgi:hypothetical protein
MIRHHYHLSDAEARRRMNELDFLGGAGGRFTGDNGEQHEKENAGPNDSGADTDC